MKKQLLINRLGKGFTNTAVKVFILFAFLHNVSVHAQLNVFDLQVSKTDETCLGNGSLTFATVNSTPLANFLFTVYKLPNLNTPVSVTTSNVLGSLNAGTYKIIATQTLGALTNSDFEEIVIENSIVPLQYSISISNQNCTQGGQITLTAVSGLISQSEIISGPVTRPLQSSAVFDNLPAGQYVIRAFNNCGEAVVVTYTLVLSSASLMVSSPSFSSGSAGNCETINVVNTVSAPEGTAISYPLNIEYIVYLAGAPDVTYTQTILNGPGTALELMQSMPVGDGVGYTYDITITDNCNAVFSNTGLTVNPNPSATISQAIGLCGKFIEINVANFKAPLTVAFTSSPAGFNPVTFNSGHPGPFNEGTIAYGGPELSTPAGMYAVEITDACGRTANAQYLLEEILPLPIAQGINNGCYAVLGDMTALVAGRTIVSATIISAPSSYNESLPDDVNDLIVDGKVKIYNFPVGDYQLLLTDSCGKQYTVPGNIPAFVESDFTITSSPYCTENLGSIQMSSGNGKLVSAFITEAPAGFQELLPLDVSSGIATSGILYLGELPEGSYTLSGTDACGIQRTVTIVVTGYAPDAQPFQFVPNCGSFDLVMSDSDTTSVEATYWMQKQHPLTGLWGHPVNGSSYQPGSVPTLENSVSLANNQTVYNLMYSGTFRIVKSHASFSTGTGVQYCLEEWEPFTYDMDLKIGDAYSMDCAESPNDIYIEAVNGLAPYTYQITEKDNMPFTVDNGNNPVFSNLEPGIYKFRIIDACQTVKVKIININLLPSLVTANPAEDILICTELTSDTNYLFDLASQDASILGEQHPDNYSVSYYTSLEDADNNVNALPDQYANISNPQTIYARVIHNSISLCYEIVAFDLHVGNNPTIDTSNSYMCEGEPVLLTAQAGYDSYLWSTGETTRSITADEAGVYSVTVKRFVGNSFCTGTQLINVAPSGVATVTVDFEDWTYDQNAITVNADGPGSYEYSLDGVTYQDSPQFTGLLIGNYTIFVRDKNGCGIVKEDVLLLNYPNFFTPNGDGTHDTWRIKYSHMEPDMNIDILDRYGKLIISLNPGGEGWDGTYNGVKMPSTDYWFVITRSNGQVHKGHFAMKR